MNEDNNSFQILVTNIFWNMNSLKSTRTNKYLEFDEQITLDVPNGVLKEANKQHNNFNDIIEQFVYNILYRKYGCEINRCQIWLPLEN
jgi:mannosyltransferase OCH1-like enzyme